MPASESAGTKANESAKGRRAKAPNLWRHLEREGRLALLGDGYFLSADQEIRDAGA